MTNTSMNPGSRPRRGLVTVAAVSAGVLGLGALLFAVGEAASPPRVAGAAELSTFASCAELGDWGAAAEQRAENFAGDVATDGAVTGGVVAESAADEATAARVTAATSPTTVAAGGDEASTGETNVDVAGVDEIDLVDRLDADRVLVVANGRLAVVDLTAGEVRSSVPSVPDAQVTYDPDAGVAWIVGTEYTDAGRAVVARVSVDGTDLSVDGTWQVRGQVVTARRAGGELYLVATDGFPADVMPIEDGSPGSEAVEPATPGVAGSEPMTTQPVAPRPAEPAEPAEPVEPGVPFGGAVVPCDEVLYPNRPSAPAATLIAAFPATGAVEPVRATEIVGVGDQVHLTLDAAYVSTPQWDSVEPVTGIHRFDLATLTATGSGAVDGVMLDQFSMSEQDGFLRVAVTTGTGWGGMRTDVAGPVASDGFAAAEAETGEARNEIVVLDTDGALDPVGRTARFGKPGESIHGVRFDGDTAYAVTFLQTDPFYVVDLSDPAAPVVVGEVELPGFSSYLHPLDGGLVVGFGPDGDGRVAAKLFDVSDPTRPRVADELSLGGESAVASDHHAFVAREGGFAVPTVDYREVFAEGCGPAEQEAAASGPAPDGCLYPEFRALGGVVVVDVRGDQLVETARPTVEGVDSVQRAIPAGDGWALLGYGEITVVDEAGTVAHRVSIA